jgi:hypothetical protein
MNALALAKLIDLALLATQAIDAMTKITALIDARRAEGRTITEDDWAALMLDRQLAMTLLSAAIAKQQKDVEA